MLGLGWFHQGDWYLGASASLQAFREIFSLTERPQKAQTPVEPPEEELELWPAEVQALGNRGKAT